MVFLLGSRRLLQGRDVHVGELRGAGVTRSLLVFGAPSARGVRDRHATQGLALFVILAIGLQNVPEGTSVAIPMDGAGFTRAQQFWAAVLTRCATALGAVAAYLAVEQVSGLLPFRSRSQRERCSRRSWSNSHPRPSRAAGEPRPRTMVGLAAILGVE